MDNRSNIYSKATPVLLNPNADKSKQSKSLYPVNGYISENALSRLKENMDDDVNGEIDYSVNPKTGNKFSDEKFQIPGFQTSKSIGTFEKGLGKTEFDLPDASQNTGFGKKFGASDFNYDNYNIEDLDGNKIGSQQETSVGGGGANWGAGASTAIAEAPGIIENFSNKPESHDEAKSLVLNSTKSGAAIGGSIMPGWGHLIGAGVGAIAGFIGTAGYKERERNNVADRYNSLWEGDREERQRLYFDQTSSERMEALQKIYKQSNGYAT